jgi:hypothetical protein
MSNNQAQQQQHQFIMPQMFQGNLNTGGGQATKNDNIPRSINAPGPGAAAGGASVCSSVATIGDDSQDEPSLDQRVKQFELMQQQPLSTSQQHPSPPPQQQMPNGRSTSFGSAATQPRPGVDELLPSRSNSTAPQQQQQQEQEHYQNQQQDNNASSVAGASISGNEDAFEAPEPQNCLGPARVGSPGSLGVAEPDPIVDGATIIRVAGAINVIAPSRRGDGVANDESGAHISSSLGADQGSENGSEQPFLDGHFAGGWQSNVDLPDRRQIIFSIIKVIERKRPDTNRMSQK